MQLESLKEFQTNSLNRAEMNSILGGGKPQWIQTSAEKVNEEGCKVKATDSYYDKNGNEKQDKNESATICVSIDCGE